MGAIDNKPPAESNAPAMKGEEGSSLLNRLFFLWMGPLFRRAKNYVTENKTLEVEDLLPLASFDHGDQVYRRFSERLAQGASLQQALLSVMWSRFIIAGCIKLVNSFLQFSFPLILNAILRYIEKGQAGDIADTDPWHERYRGYWLSALLFTVMVTKAVAESAYFQRINRCALHTRVAVSVAVYNKSLELANAERQSTTLGELVNLMQVDATKMEMFIPQAHVLWDGLIQIIGYMTILYSLIGWPCFAGLGLMIVSMPVQALVVKSLFALNRKMVTYTDDRVRTTNEALQGMQSVKMFAWEQNFSKMITTSRAEELSLLGRVAFLRGFSRAFISALPGLVACLSFVVYALVFSDDISASTLFAALVAFDQLRFPLLFYPMALANYAQASVSGGRVSKFLALKEVSNNKIGTGTYERREDDHKGGIEIEGATVYWADPTIPLDSNGSEHSKSDPAASNKTDEEDTQHSKTSDDQLESNSGMRYPKPVLKDITLKVQPGELCAVVGRVASGKSTLASALLNEALLDSGDIRLMGKVAYASQSPWILNATLRDNILFGLPYDEERYNAAVKACQLTHDLTMLDNGDLTEIGEKGINLSGGQKQRVSIARAAYSNADTILLDDPLSALDPEVGKLLFDECIVEFMAGKTRLLITNQLQFLKFCDTVVALRKGRVIEQGKFADLAANEDGEVTRLLRELGTDENPKSEGESETRVVKEKVVDGPGSKSAKTNDGGALVTKEERATGAVPFSVYKNYLRSGGGLVKFGFVYVAFLLSAVVSTSNVAWISFWTSDAPGYERNPQSFYLGIYAGLAIALGFTSYLATFLLIRFGVGASKRLHSDLIESILRAPQSFFDTTPIGRILSRFSKDLYTIDVELAETLDFTVMLSLSILFAIGSIMFVTPLFGVAIPPLAFLYIRTMNYFRNVSRETKRLESLSRSPVFALFSETLGGLSTIRAYGLNGVFLKDFESKVNDNTRASYNNRSADRWIAIRLESVGASIAALAAFFASFASVRSAVSGEASGGNFASLAGLSLTFAISITSILNFGVRIFAQLEAAMNSSERVLFYTENIPQEAPPTVAELAKSTGSGDSPSEIAVKNNNGKPEVISEEWPTKGEIVFNNLKMRYRTDTPLVLKGLTATIKPGERIGVVGRTGSGKSSLLLTLLRIVEPALTEEGNDKYQSPISIDDVDILRIGLRDLRSRVGIIPQNPVLFSGTIRSNIDPFDQYTDADIWTALERCDLKGPIEEMPGGLSGPVSEYGENLSAGMRQMLVIARALLRNCRVLLLDEATSNVDFETDQAIQRTLREAFPGSTVLTIAHRVNTILDSDKIMVLQDGLIAEFAPPAELLADENSAFSDIVRHAESEAN